VINLLPPDLKNAYRYGRLNVALRRWAIVGLLVLVGLGIISTYGLLTFRQSTNNYNHQISSAQNQLQKDDLTQTEKQSQDISSSLRLAVKVLSGEVLFSKLISQIGSVMPDGAVLSELDINKAYDGINLTANATSYTTATQVQVNLTAPSNKIFAKVDIVSIVCQTDGSKYPCIVQLRAQFNAKNQFLFINQGAKP
jgi:Tfp pilus assembly protein PilN